MRTRTKLTVAGAALALGTVGVGAAMVGASSGDDQEPAISGDALDRASAAALAHTGEGRVTDTEVGDEDSYYEVEVTLDDGSQVDVQLDEEFHVVDATADHEDPAGDTDED